VFDGLLGLHAVGVGQALDTGVIEFDPASAGDRGVGRRESAAGESGRVEAWRCSPEERRARGVSPEEGMGPQRR
jgi:hypothetical protein